MEDKFSIDLGSLYNKVGDSETEYGFCIKHTKNCNNDYYDLYYGNSPILICDGEECYLIEVDDDYISIGCNDNPYGNDYPIRFSKKEFTTVCNNRYDIYEDFYSFE